MRLLFWGLLLVSSVLCQYKLLFNPISVELYDMENRFLARAFRDDAFQTYGEIRTAGCSPSDEFPDADPVVFQCFAEIPEDMRTYSFRVTPEVRRGELPDVNVAKFDLVINTRAQSAK